MKNLIYILTLITFFSCSSIKTVDRWKSKNHADFKPQKVLIVGITENLIARRIFEEELKEELNLSGVEAMESYEILTPKFTSEKQTEENIQEEIEKITKNGFDAILISAVKGIDEKVIHNNNYYTDYYYRRHPFRHYYYLHQEVYFDTGYYNKYKIYHVETSLYKLKENNDKSLVWVISNKIVEPSSINTTVNDYVSVIIKSLKKEGIIVSNK
ncbi:hypothetical protein BTO04_10540 [Polaribacter sp. SA4-10]|uniref:hypothetical protein n=1 Tax=Polaribacter sp. SA4-10 TaxID=754397 RepID=UPI000B3C2DA4|nr:hypothetical protein [Polaribacter sp. SA4-10]ARV07097.1 hypothetical protein BTO04_10540 [Polaribacter sp. SA4-10]